MDYQAVYQSLSQPGQWYDALRFPFLVKYISISNQICTYIEKREKSFTDHLMKLKEKVFQTLFLLYLWKVALKCYLIGIKNIGVILQYSKKEFKFTAGRASGSLCVCPQRGGLCASISADVTLKAEFTCHLFFPIQTVTG